MTFEQLGLAPELVKGLADERITTPTPIQERSIPVLLQKKDVYVCSATGTGKTLAYLLPLFQNIDIRQKSVQAMVIAPTHELAMQIFRQAKKLAESSGMGVRTLALIGGVAVKRQIEGLKHKPHLIVGSTGRILHLMDLKKINGHTITTVVVDEVDRLLGGDTTEKVRDLIARTSRSRRLVYVSATVQPVSLREVKVLAPEVIEIHVHANQVSSTISHQYLVCEEREKGDVLRKLMHALHPHRAIAFVHRNRTAEIIADRLRYHKLPVADIHGAHDKLSRQKGIEDLQKGRVRLLLASDVAARGLDIRDVTHIFNVDIPSSSKDYLHRVGRTGRAGAQGCALSLVTPQEVRIVQRFRKELGIEISPVRLFRGAVEVCTSDEG
ncbi:DEAD/DEAH box helicase [Desulfoplanes formicivorans]|nr:DEAD/DEAH box helicase [Desulfoplanes formicivorans]